ncbi:MAG: hypothetical protein ACTHLJ_11290 [Angustibacter sp.]
MDGDPLVTPFAPALGWHVADLPRRAFAVLCVVLLPGLVWLAWSGRSGSAVLLALTVGPPSCYSLARVLRPHRSPSPERTWRHGLASTATSAAVPVVAVLVQDAVGPIAHDAGLAMVFLGVPAAFLGLVTSLWGLVAIAARARYRRTGRRPLSDLVDPREPGLG